MAASIKTPDRKEAFLQLAQDYEDMAGRTLSRPLASYILVIGTLGVHRSPVEKARLQDALER